MPATQITILQTSLGDMLEKKLDELFLWTRTECQSSPLVRHRIVPQRFFAWNGRNSRLAQDLIDIARAFLYAVFAVLMASQLRQIKLKSKLNVFLIKLKAITMDVIDVKAEITGNVWKILVQTGDRIEADAPILILESMKMEIPVSAPKAGTVQELLVSEGQVITEGTIVARLEV